MRRGGARRGGARRGGARRRSRPPITCAVPSVGRNPQVEYSGRPSLDRRAVDLVVVCEESRSPPEWRITAGRFDVCKPAFPHSNMIARVEMSKSNRRTTWMRPNIRVLWFAAFLGALSLAVATLAAIWLPGTDLGWIGRSLADLVGSISLVILVRAVRRIQSARLALEGDYLVVDLGTPSPLRVPIDIVECFFLGQGPSLLPVGGFGNGRKPPETSTVVVRLADRASQWRQRDVKPALGHWCDGYITIRGIWSEPINGELVRRLNANLIEAHRQLKCPGESESP
jgi:hypothetical protein